MYSVSKKHFLSLQIIQSLSYCIYHKMCIRDSGDGRAVIGLLERQTGVLAHPFHVQGIHLDLAAGHGEGRRLTA